jgi:hypothetical protein
MSVVIAMRVHLMAKARIVTVPGPAPSLVFSRLIALNGGVLHLALTGASRGCAQGWGQGNSSPAVTSGWSSPWGLAGIPKLPKLLLLSRGQLVKLGIWIVPVNNVGLLVNFKLGNKSLLAIVRGLGSLSLVMSAWVIPAPAPTMGNRGNLLGLWVIGRVVCALEFHISILNRVKVSKIGMVSIDWRLHSIERGVPDSILEPEGLEVLSERHNPVLLEVWMLVMLLNMKIHILVKIEVLAISVIPEGLQLGHNGAPGRHNTLPTKEKSVQGPIHLLHVLGLAELFHVISPARFPPASMEDVVNRDHIGQETGLKRPVTL